MTEEGPNRVRGSDTTKWWGLIGISAPPSVGGIIVVPHDKARRLQKTVRLGPLELQPGDRKFVEWRRPPHAVNAWECIESWPIIVQGRSTGSSPVASARAEARQLQRAAALVALAWREPWDVRLAPRPRSSLPPMIPDSDPSPHSWSEPPLDISPVECLLPAWVDEAWSQLQAAEPHDRALQFWHQAFLIESSHPSIAAVAYAAVVESLAGTEWGRSVAPPESDHEGSRAKFRRLANAYATEEEQPLVDRWYGRRSSTAHGAWSHGVESFPGALFDLGHQQLNGEVVVGGRASEEFDEAAAFALRFMATARAVTARVLEACLRDAD